MRSTPRPIAEGISLFLLLILAIDALYTIPTAGVSASALMQVFYFLAFVHIGVSLYVGGFDRLRMITWLLLILSWTAAEFAAFARLILPLGQTLFWVSVNMPWAEPMLAWLLNNVAIVPTVLLGILLVDVIVMHRRSWATRPWWLLVVFIAASVAVDLAMRVMLQFQPAQPTGLEPSLAVVPAWNLLPFYSILRSVPDKAIGVVVFFAAMILPMIWPLMKVDRLRSGSRHRAWLIAWLGFIAAFIGLGYLGAKPPEDAILLTSRFLVAWYFLFLLVVPPVLRRLNRSG